MKNNDELPLPEAIARGKREVEERSHQITQGAEITCRQVGELFDLAINHGAPIWNRGSKRGCSELYLHTVSCFVNRLKSQGKNWTTPFRDYRSILEAVIEQYPTVTEENADSLGWTLRAIFDQFHAERGMEAVAELIDILQRNDQSDPEVILLIVKVALMHGNQLYEVKAFDGCAVLHHFTTSLLLDWLQGFDRGHSNTPAYHRPIRQALSTILRDYPEVTEENEEAVAWKCYECFCTIPKLLSVKAPPAKPLNDAFISYRRSGGSEMARMLRSELKLRGLNSYIDVSNLDSGPFGPQLFEQIAKSPSFILILSQGCLARCAIEGDWMRTEILHAMKHRRNIIPILMDGFSFPDASQLPEELRPLVTYQAVPYSHHFVDAVIDRVVQYMNSGSARLGSDSDVVFD